MSNSSHINNSLSYPATYNNADGFTNNFILANKNNNIPFFISSSNKGLHRIRYTTILEPKLTISELINDLKIVRINPNVLPAKFLLNESEFTIEKYDYLYRTIIDITNITDSIIKYFNNKKYFTYSNSRFYRDELFLLSQIEISYDYHVSDTALYLSKLHDILNLRYGRENNNGFIEPDSIYDDCTYYRGNDGDIRHGSKGYRFYQKKILSINRFSRYSKRLNNNYFVSEQKEGIIRLEVQLNRRYIKDHNISLPLVTIPDLFTFLKFNDKREESIWKKKLLEGYMV